MRGEDTADCPNCRRLPLAYNLGNFLRQLALPREVRHWSLTTLVEKLIKIGAKVRASAHFYDDLVNSAALRPPA
jgi:hypothetical protein